MDVCACVVTRRARMCGHTINDPDSTEVHPRLVLLQIDKALQALGGHANDGVLLLDGILQEVQKAFLPARGVATTKYTLIYTCVCVCAKCMYACRCTYVHESVHARTCVNVDIDRLMSDKADGCIEHVIEAACNYSNTHADPPACTACTLCHASRRTHTAATQWRRAVHARRLNRRMPLYTNHQTLVPSPLLLCLSTALCVH